MRLLIQNPENKILAGKKFALSPEYSFFNRVLLVMLWVVLFPICLVLYVMGKIVIGALMLSGQTAFRIVEARTYPELTREKRYRLQVVRSYINNQLASPIPHINAAFRRFLFRLSGVRIGRRVFIGMNGYMEDLNPENVIFEDNAVCSFEVTFIAHGRKKGKTLDEKYIIVRKNAYIGARAVILPGVEIGESAIVGAGSVVTKDVPAGAIVVGNPARIIDWQEGFKAPEQPGNTTPG